MGGGTHGGDGDIEQSIVSLDEVTIVLDCHPFVRRIRFEGGAVFETTFT